MSYTGPMPTDPQPGILDRHLYKVQLEREIEEGTKVLQEIVNYATRVFARCSHNSPKVEDLNGPPHTLFLRIIELADAIEVLVREPTVRPAYPLLRVIFECLLQLEYILESRKKWERRSRAFIVCDMHRRIQAMRMIDDSTQVGKNFRASLLADREFKGLLESCTPPIEEARKEILRLEHRLNQGEWIEIEHEYIRIRKRRQSGDIPFYSLFSNLQNLPALAHALGRPAMFQVFYQPWSQATHGTEWLSFFSGKSDSFGRACIWGIRHPNGFPGVISDTVLLLSLAIKAMLSFYRPGESALPWFEREIRPALSALSSLELNFVVSKVEKK